MLLIDPWPMPHLMGHELPLRGGLFLRIGSLLGSQNMLGEKKNGGGGRKRRKKNNALEPVEKAANAGTTVMSIPCIQEQS